MFALLRQARALMLDIRGGGGEGMYAGTGTYWGREITSGDEAFGRPRVEDSGADAVCFGAICVDSDSMGGVNGYGEVRGYGDHPEPYDRCNRYGCGY